MHYKNKMGLISSIDIKKGNLVNSLSKNKAYTVQTLLDAIDKAGTIISTSGGSSGGGGGGSKSSGSGFTLNGVTTILPENEKFNDINLSLWAKDAIISLSDKNILSGYEDGSFKPTNLIKREEFVKVIVSAFNVTGEDKEIEFFDVEKDKWYYPYIKSAFNSGIRYLKESFIT
ncbi:MAG: S-layer homology domain-containing protein [Ruminococcaceae bacterium]|nr:S-layer homology domain-containing protein [Oscillospiraceae bacterium]